MSVAFVFTGRFEQLLTSCLFASWLFYALGGLAVFALRRDPSLERPYRVPGYPIVPALFVLAALAAVASSVRQNPGNAAKGAGLLLLGVPVFFAWRRRRTV